MLNSIIHSEVCTGVLMQLQELGTKKDLCELFQGYIVHPFAKCFFFIRM